MFKNQEMLRSLEVLHSKVDDIINQLERLSKAFGSLPKHLGDQLDLHHKLSRKEDMQMLVRAVEAMQEEVKKND